MTAAAVAQRRAPSLFTATVGALIAVLVLVASAPVAAADPTAFKPDPRYSPALTARIGAYNTAVKTLFDKVGDLKSRSDDLSSRIDKHNHLVDSYPNRTAPPSVADRINNEGAQLRAEQGRLTGELQELKAESDRLEGEHDVIAEAARMELNAIIQANPPSHTAPQPGNQYQRLPEPQSPIQPQARAGGNPTHPTKPTGPAPKQLRPEQVTGPADEALPGVPSGVEGTLTRNGKGYVYPLSPTPGIDRRVSAIRVMNPTTTPGGHDYPNGYVVYENAQGQPVNPGSGAMIHTKSDPYRHIPL